MKRITDNKRINELYLFLSASILFCALTIFILNITSEFTYKVFSQNTYLIIHLLMEFTSALIGFSTFAVLYYTFDLFKQLRYIFLANLFLVVSFIDILHVMSYDGMPAFLTGNTPQKATAYWIIGRILMSIGLLVFSLLSKERKTKIDRKVFLGTSILILMIIFIIVTYNIGLIPPLFINGVGLTPLKVTLEYIIVGINVLTSFILLREHRRFKSGHAIGLLIALVFSNFSELTFTLYVNVFDTYNLLGHIFKIIAYFAIFKAIFLSTIRNPYTQLSEVQNELKKYADNLEKLVDEKTEELVEKNKNLIEMNKKILEDLESAKEIQEALLPQRVQEINGVNFYSKYLPCERLSGDFYNYFKIDDENIGVYIIDVSGHGVPAAMLTIFASRILKGNIFDLDEESDYSIISPSDVVSNFYEIFNESNFPDENYLVMFYGIYNTERNELTYSSAGHNCPPMIVKRDGEVKDIDYGDGFPICKLEGIIDPKYKDYKVKLTKGDKILFYTDGIVEAKDENDNLYTADRLERLVKENKENASQEIIQSIIQDLSSHKALDKLEDDVTLFIMEV
nr:MASE3 domain-containing protein [Sporosalibacterium faouarense]